MGAGAGTSTEQHWVVLLQAFGHVVGTQDSLLGGLQGSSGGLRPLPGGAAGKLLAAAFLEACNTDYSLMPGRRCVCIPKDLP